jgi:hypothetical protein
MIKCKVINFLFSFIPLKRWQDFLLSHHIQRCPLCQKKMASLEEVRSLFIPEGDMESVPGLWPEVRMRLGEGKVKKSFGLRRLAWIAGAAILLAAVAASVWLFIIPGRNASSERLVERFQINYIRVGSGPARAYVFKPYDSNMIFVWAERETKEEENDD